MNQLKPLIVSLKPRARVIAHFRAGWSIGILVLLTVTSGCAHRAWMSPELFVSVSIGHTAIGGGATWIVDDKRIRIQSGPPTQAIVFYEAELAPKDRAAILAALKSPEVSRLRGQRTTVSKDPDGIVLSDFAYVQVSLKRDATEKDSIFFIGQASDIALPLLSLIDALFPVGKRFIQPANSQPAAALD